MRGLDFTSRAPIGEARPGGLSTTAAGMRLGGLALVAGAFILAAFTDIAPEAIEE